MGILGTAFIFALLIGLGKLGGLFLEIGGLAIKIITRLFEDVGKAVRDWLNKPN